MSRFGYSGEGFVYLQKVAEKLTGKSLDQIATQEVFEPLGMENSSYVWRTDYADRVAVGHNSRGEPITTTRRAEGNGNAAASLLTTAGDYANRFG